MHFEFLVEDSSGKKALEVLFPRIVGPHNTHNTHNIIPYKGIGRIPANLNSAANVRSRLLLDQLPSVLRAYGKAFAIRPQNDPAVVVVVCDLDNKCLKIFRNELDRVLNCCNPQPVTRFCIAVEEGEAWLLGDLNAVRLAYPRAKDSKLVSYQNDSICGTWELLADAVYVGGSSLLKSRGWQAAGREKARWASDIAPLVALNNNRSQSFRYFLRKVRELSD